MPFRIKFALLAIVNTPDVLLAIPEFRVRLDWIVNAFENITEDAELVITFAKVIGDDP